uniref:Uncharacterized protein n=1 Tax=Salix viminalis TaxID=40686 RepID=A0A6N2KPC8_SALVM
MAFPSQIYEEDWQLKIISFQINRAAQESIRIELIRVLPAHERHISSSPPSNNLHMVRKPSLSHCHEFS